MVYPSRISLRKNEKQLYIHSRKMNAKVEHIKYIQTFLIFNLFLTACLLKENNNADISWGPKAA